MKKICFAVTLMVTALCSAVCAGDLLKYAPEGAQLIANVDVSEIVKRPEVIKFLQSEDAMAKQQEFASKVGFGINDINCALLVINGSGSGVLFVETTKKIDVASAIKKLNINAVAKKSGKNEIWCFDGNSYICQVSDKVFALGDDDDIERALGVNTKCGVSGEMAKMVNSCRKTDNVAWMVFADDNAMSGILSYAFVGKDKKDHEINISIKVANEAQAKQMAAVIPMYTGMFVGAVFGDNPELGAKVMSCVVPFVKDSQFGVKIRLSAALVDEIISYVAAHGREIAKAAESI